MGNAPVPFPSFPPLTSPFLLSEVVPWKPAKGLGELCKLPQWGPGQSSGRKHILMYFELKSRTCQQRFWLFILAWNGAT